MVYQVLGSGSGSEEPTIPVFLLFLCQFQSLLQIQVGQYSSGVDALKLTSQPSILLQIL